MINTQKFAERLKIVLDYYGLSAASFADKIGVQRSSISHILSGRNKPSLDFVMKILNTYPEVDLYWILNGKGHFPSQSLETRTQLVSDEKVEKSFKSGINSDLEIERIVIFYSDSTFKSFSN